MNVKCELTLQFVMSCIANRVSQKAATEQFNSLSSHFGTEKITKSVLQNQINNLRKSTVSQALQQQRTEPPIALFLTESIQLVFSAKRWIMVRSHASQRLSSI